MSPGDKPAYRIQLNRGQYLRVTVEQRRIDVAVSITAADGRPLARMDSPYGFLGVESVSLLADQTGDYVVELLPVGKAGAGGRYVLKAEPPREPTPSDLKRVQAERAFAEARNKHVPASLKIAVEKYKESLAHWVELADLYWQGKTLYALASACFALRQIGEATQHYKQALSIQELIQDKRGQAYSLKDLGFLLGIEGNLTESAELSNRALLLWQEDNDLANKAGTLNNRAVVYGLSGEPQQAIDYHNQVIKIRLDLEDLSGKGQSLINIGTIYDSIGEPQTALDYYNEALSILRGIENPKTEDRRREATALNNIGYAYATLSDPELALSYYEQALPIRKEVRDPIGEGVTLANMGNAYLAMGDSQTAMTHYNQALPKQNDWGKLYTLMNIGDAHSAAGNTQAALEHYERASKLFKGVPDYQGEAAALDKIGRIHARLGKLQEADNSYEQALGLWRKVKDRRGEATTLEGLARNKLARNDLTGAHKQVEAAIHIAENLRTGILSPQLRASYFASVRNYYDLEIDVLMQMHRQQPSGSYDRRALEISERSRGRVLLEVLGEGNAGLLRKASSSLAQRRHLLVQQLHAKAGRQLYLLSTSDTTGEEKSGPLDREIRSLINQIETVEGQIRAENPRYTALVRPQPLDVEGIQKILDPDTILLEYVLGDRRSYLWVVTEKSVASFELPGRAKIEEAALKVYELTNARNHVVKGESPLQTEKRIEEAERKYPGAASELSQILLGPAAPLPASKRLVIVPDGKLQYVPFAALPLLSLDTQPPASPDVRTSSARVVQTTGGVKGGETKDGGGYQPLITKYEIVRLPSVSMMAVLRRELRGRAPAPRAVAVLADPVFTADDSRLGRREAQGQKVTGRRPAGRKLERALKDVGLGADEAGIPRLVFSRREADSIAALAGEQRTKKVLDFEASRSMATSHELSQYRIVHFSTHGLLNEKHPELSGIVLSLVDEQGRPQNGFLTLNDIYELNLPAELVVLSACQTALGKDVRGEGLIGLTRGIMYAGAARVVASLWKVDDAATSVLMRHFYRLMLQDGKRPAEALRYAQLEMWKQERWRPPCFWAAFTIQGEWK